MMLAYFPTTVNSRSFAAAGREPLPTAAGLLTTQTLLDHNQKHHDIRVLSVEVFFVGGGRGKLFFSAVHECHLCV